MKQKIALKDLDRLDIESEFNASVENLILNGSTWVFERSSSMIFDLCKDVTKSSSIYVELALRDLACSKFKYENDKVCGAWCIIAHLRTIKTNA